MSTGVFDQDTTTTTKIETIVPASVNPFDDKLKEIVNDQGEPKYKDVTSALDALKASQAHIKQLEDEAKARLAEQTQLREELKSKEALEDVVRRLQSNNDPARTVTQPNASLSEDAIAKTIDRVLSQRDVKVIAQKNVDDVTSVLTTKFGDKTKEVVAAKAAELGMTPRELGELSSNKPMLVLSLFGEKPLTVNPTTSSVTTQLNPVKVDNELKRPEKSLLVGPGANDKTRGAMMEQIKKKIYKQYDVETA